jgi:hypothetical protein
LVKVDRPHTTAPSSPLFRLMIMQGGQSKLAFARLCLVKARMLRVVCCNGSMAA